MNGYLCFFVGMFAMGFGAVLGIYYVARSMLGLDHIQRGIAITRAISKYLPKR